MSPPLAYWHCGGEVLCARGLALAPSDAEALLGLYLDEARAAAVVGDQIAQATALRLALQLSEAKTAAMRWSQAASAYLRTR
jgi:hypothetical protein